MSRHDSTRARKAGRKAGQKTGQKAGNNVSLVTIRNRGRKAIRGVNLAACLGVEPELFHQRVGERLLLFSHGSWFQVAPERRKPGSPPAIAFQLNGVIMAASAMRDDAVVDACIKLLPSMKTRRRSSKNQSRRPTRVDDAAIAAAYGAALVRAQQQFHKLLRR